MKTALAISCLALFSWNGSFGSQLSTNDLAQTPAAHWSYIQYPWNENPWDRGYGPTFVVGWPAGGQDESSRGLRMDIMDISQGFAFFKTNSISARLYRADGEIVEPTVEGKKLLKAPIAVSTGWLAGQEPSPQVLTYFPWGPNILQESWIEVTIGSERYWVEIPYGFDRNPADPPAPDNTNGPPRFAPEMDSLNEHDHVVRWNKVIYDVGHAPDGSELKLYQSNPFDAQSDVDLYNFPKSENVYSPRVQVRLLENDGTVITGRCVNIHLDDNYLRRTDTFAYGRNSGAKREWGKIEVRVGDKTYNVTVPSSLYQYCEGHALTPASVDYLSKLRVGMTFEEADLDSRNYVTNGLRSHPVASVPGQYRSGCWRSGTNEVTLQFDASDKLVGWQ